MSKGQNERAARLSLHCDKESLLFVRDLYVGLKIALGANPRFGNDADSKSMVASEVEGSSPVLIQLPIVLDQSRSVLICIE